MNIRTLLLNSVALFAAYDGDTPTLDVTAPLRDGKLVFKVGDKEELIDPSEIWSGRSKISALNREAQGHRTNAEKATADLAKFKDIDPEKARAAFDTLSKIDQKKLVDAGKIDEVRAEIGKSFQDQLADRDGKITKLSTKLQGRILGDAFRDCKYLTDNLAIPIDIAQATFKDLFTVSDDGDVITAKDRQGNPVYSRDPARSGLPANFDEAIQIIIDGYPNKNAILKGNNNSGSGNQGGGGNKGGGNRMSRADWDKLPEADKAAKSKDVAARTLIIVD